MSSGEDPRHQNGILGNKDHGQSVERRDRSRKTTRREVACADYLGVRSSPQYGSPNLQELMVTWIESDNVRGEITTLWPKTAD